jgi:hypothetical protein
MKKPKWKWGDKVICNGAPGIVKDYYDLNLMLVHVDLYSNNRYVGQVCVGENEIGKMD